MYNNIDENITVKERGWAGHWICGSRCNYHRNTLISFNNKKIVVSTIGKYQSPLTAPDYCIHLINGFESIGGGEVEGNRYYETEIGYARFIRGYWEYSPNDDIYDDSLMEYQNKVSRVDPSFNVGDERLDISKLEELTNEWISENKDKTIISIEFHFVSQISGNKYGLILIIYRDNNATPTEQ